MSTKFKKLLETIDKEELIELFKNHSFSYVANHYNLSAYQFKNVLDYFEISNHTRQDNLKMACQEKYGVDNVFQLESVKNKSKETKLTSYGDENYNNPNKRKETCLSVYGTPSASGNEQIKAKIKETNIERYGVDNPFKDKELMESSYIKNSGSLTVHYQKQKDSRKESLMNKYGVENVSQIKSTRYKAVESMRKTCVDKYGVEYPCLLPQCQFSSGNSSLSSPNVSFASFLSANNVEFRQEFTINNKSYDFKINDILVEINPTCTHNSTYSPFGTPKEKEYHFNKSKLAFENGFRCIHVWDWDDKNKIINLLFNRETVYARNCVVKEIDAPVDYLNEHHLQGYTKSDTYIGLLYNEHLVSVMTFGKPRYNKNYDYELIRYCSSYNVIGGAEKLFAYFVRNYKPKSIISYCDYSKFNGDVYNKLGFKRTKVNIGKHWYNEKTKQHILDTSLLKVGFDQLFKTDYGKGTSNEKLMLEHGFVEIYDAGQATFIWKNKGID